MRSGRIFCVSFVLLLVLGCLPFSVISFDVASAQRPAGYFEGRVPIQGHYLRAINTYPGVTNDSDDDGVLDKGCTWDDNYDGVAERHVVGDPLIVDLEANGFSPGDMVMISFDQSIYSTTFNIFALHVYGLFSSSRELLKEEYTYTSSSGEGWPMVGPLRRVPGAIDAALGGNYVHGPQDDTNTWKQGREVENDIPEDFRVGGYQETNGWKNYDSYSTDKYWFSQGFWIGIPPGAKFLFFEVAGGYWNVGDSGICTVSVDRDSDRDGLPDSWERVGIDFNRDGRTDLTLKDASPDRPDIYVEVDWLPGHKPDVSPINDVKRAFDEAPVFNPLSAKWGINLHVDLDEGVLAPASPDSVNMWEHFDLIKKSYFGTSSERDSVYTVLAKKWAYHYCVFIHQYADWNVTAGSFETTTKTGLGERPGNDFVCATGSLTTHGGKMDEQAAIFMHELGHNLGLKHGGQDDINYKPNYLSVMNYMYVFNYPVQSRPLDFSREKLKTLDESNLDEVDGLGVDSVASYSGGEWHSTLRPDDVVDSFRRIDWSGTGAPYETSVSANINNFPRCDYTSPEGEPLESYVDWNHLDYYFCLRSSFPDGVHTSDPGSSEEITGEVVELLYQIALANGAVYVESTPQEVSSSPEASGSKTTNPFFIFFGQVASFVGSNSVLVGVAVAAVVVLIVVSLVLKRRKGKTSQPAVAET